MKLQNNFNPFSRFGVGSNPKKGIPEMGLGSEKMLHVLKSENRDVEGFLDKCTIRILCNKCFGFGCAHCQGYGFTREIIDKKRIYEVW